VVIADARDPVGVAAAVEAAGGPADVTVVCVDAPGCEGGAILCTAQGGTVIFFSMATSFSAAALGAEGMAADVRMLVGNGYVPGHADLALELIRTNGAVRALFERRVAG
jgi:L-erythro-3,5-diaminohexanoate dehydrogenase